MDDVTCMRESPSFLLGYYQTSDACPNLPLVRLDAGKYAFTILNQENTLLLPATKAKLKGLEMLT